VLDFGQEFGQLQEIGKIGLSVAFFARSDQF
jgi:hypothetical protein